VGVDEASDRDEVGPLDLREISRAALVTAAALVLPVVFHVVHLGHVFLPMYLPVLAGAFLLRPRTASLTGAAAPIVSATATGMPPLFPPVAAWMGVELASMAALASVLHRRTRLPVPATVALVLVLGRAVYAAAAYATGLWLDLPARLFTLAALLTGWPGMILALLAVPGAVRLLAPRWRSS
jgi:hypothetical protein